LDQKYFRTCCSWVELHVDDLGHGVARAVERIEICDLKLITASLVCGGFVQRVSYRHGPIGPF
jgi:hypothetical protein